MIPAGHAIQYAGLGIRFLAMLVDALLLLFLYALGRFAPVLITPAAYLAPAEPRTPLLITPLELVLGFGAAMVITALLWNRFSGTPGKLLVGIRVVTLPGGDAPSVRRGMLRFGGYLVSLAPAALGFLWSLWDKKRQGFHDKLSHTAVIIDDESTKTLAQLVEEAR